MCLCKRWVLQSDLKVGESKFFMSWGRELQRRGSRAAEGCRPHGGQASRCVVGWIEEEDLTVQVCVNLWMDGDQYIIKLVVSMLWLINVCAHVFLFPVHSACCCVFVEGSTVPIMLPQAVVCQAPSIWHVFDVEIQGAKNPSSLSPVPVCVLVCVRARVQACVLERERQRATSHNKDLK